MEPVIMGEQKSWLMQREEEAWESERAGTGVHQIRIITVRL